MSAERDVNRIVRSWIRAEEHESADRVLQTVLSRLDATPQRRSAWPSRRIAGMQPYVRLALAAAAAAAVAIVGMNLLSRPAGIGTPTMTPAPTLAPTLAPTPTPPPVAPTSASPPFPQAGDLAPGTYSMRQEGIEYTFAVSGTEWLSKGQYTIDRIGGEGPDAASIIFWTDTPIGVYADPCGSQRGPALGVEAAALASAVAALPGTDLVRGPSDVTVGGRPAKHVVVRIRDDVACQPGSMYLWYAATPGIARTATALGSTIYVWIIDVGSTLIWIDGETFEGAEPALERELQEIIDSIDFDP